MNKISTKQKLRQNPDRPAHLEPGSRGSALGKSIAIALGLFIVSMVMNLVGIYWGVPDSFHIRSYHPDEWRVIEAATRINPFAGQINPGFYNYGSLYIYVLWAAFNLCQVFGIVNAHPDPHIFDPANFAALYVCARVVTCLFSAGAVLITWRLGRQLWGPRSGLLSALLLALSPLWVVHSHYATVDVPATFWMVAAVLGASKFLKKDVSGSAPSLLSPGLLFGAVAAGLALGTKYNAGIALFAVWFAWAWRVHQSARSEKPTPPSIGQQAGDVVFGCTVLAAIGFVAFVISTPGFLTDSRQFMADFTFELHHSATGHEFVFSHTAPGFIYHITKSLWIGLGPPLCVVAIIGALYALLRRSTEDALLAVVAVPYYIVIGMAQVKFMRYAIPLLPFLCLWGARLIIQALYGSSSGARSGIARPKLTARIAATLAMFICLGWATAESFAYTTLLAAPDVRDLAMIWISNNIPPRSTIGLIRTPWFDMPPLVFSNTGMPTDLFLKLQSNRMLAGNFGNYHFDILDYDSATLKAQKPEWVIYSEWQMRYRLRLHQLNPNGHSADAQAGRQSANLMQTLSRYYRVVAIFKTAPRVFGVPLKWGFIPDDWLYPNPAIIVMERRQP